MSNWDAEEEIPDMNMVNEEIKKLPVGYLEIFCLLSAGYQHHEIANQLHIDVFTSNRQYCMTS